MRKNLVYVLTAVLCNGLFLACDSTDNSIDCPEDFTGALATNEEKLPGDWVLTAMTADTEVDLTDDQTDNPSTDLFAQYEDCQKDARYSFGANRTYLYLQSQNAENCDNEVTLGGTWQLTEDLLSLTGSCNVSNIPLNFKDDATAFSFTETFNIADAEGKTIQANVTFTYTLTEL
ncbi:DUF5004 domain-containing protein [Zobellia roscoffensis]|uniref:DUF5004 domain-containing protein n=1 Tax=Zobellia roscoffensis TaxID=2779508 RepID=UPI00188DB8CA|nr:DUF5004 domain-containing protein [Zobellia roscoffensis]